MMRGCLLIMFSPYVSGETPMCGLTPLPSGPSDGSGVCVCVCVCVCVGVWVDERVGGWMVCLRVRGVKVCNSIYLCLSVCVCVCVCSAFLVIHARESRVGPTTERRQPSSKGLR